jgi:soluble lytic murein transglycosylase-like protein
MHRMPHSTEMPPPLSVLLPSIPLIRPVLSICLSLAVIVGGSFWNAGKFQLTATWSENRSFEQLADPLGASSTDTRSAAARMTDLRFGDSRASSSLETLQPAELAIRADARQLTREQHTLAQFLAKRYRVALESAQEFVDLSYRVARDLKLDPWLILAIMGIESSFDPNAKSNKGAQGLMQVLTRVHADKFTPFGGVAAAFDPLANIRVGAKILKDYIDRDGSIESGLKSYVGAAFMSSDSGYGDKVLVERERLAAVAQGRPMNAVVIKPPLSTELVKVVGGPSIIEIKNQVSYEASETSAPKSNASLAVKAPTDAVIHHSNPVDTVRNAVDTVRVPEPASAAPLELSNTTQ